MYSVLSAICWWNMSSVLLAICWWNMYSVLLAICWWNMLLAICWWNMYSVLLAICWWNMYSVLLAIYWWNIYSVLSAICWGNMYSVLLAEAIVRDAYLCMDILREQIKHSVLDNKVYGANKEPTWVLSAPDWPHVGPMNLAIRGVCQQFCCQHQVKKTPSYWYRDSHYICKPETVVRPS